MRPRPPALAALLLASCIVDVPSPQPIPAGDFEAFAGTVQPVLDARCASPTCHGQPDRPLAIFSAGQYRRDPARTFLEESLDPGEQAANARQVAAFVLDVLAGGWSVDDCLMLRKPLALAQGGCSHKGGEIFRSRDDREYRALRTWLTGLVDPAVARP